MKKFREKVAVITGAASGIGKGIAERCIHEEMKVVLADIEEDALVETEREFKEKGGDVRAFITDVSREGDIKCLARRTLEEFGAVHLVFNNAGVAAGSTIWESTLSDWEWVIGVNLWGVVHMIRTFVPIMIAQDCECYVVNTASIAGLISGPGLGIYKVTKYGIVTLSETLFHELVQRGLKIRVSVLCPSFVNTNLIDSSRNRPVNLQNKPEQDIYDPVSDEIMQEIRQALRAGLSIEEVSDHVFKAIKEEKFYILTHPEYKPYIKTRFDDILDGRDPTFLPFRMKGKIDFQ